MVTGGAGFIGINLCLKLLKSGDKIFILDNFITSERSKLAILKNKKNWKFIETDVSCKLPDSLKRERFNQIYHLACPTGVPNLTRLSVEMLFTSAYGTRNILELAKTSGASFLFSSSSEVYGDAKIHPQSESYTGNVDCVGIRSPYEEEKRFAESLTVTYFRKYKLDCKVVRIFNTYGPYMSRGDERVIPRFLRQTKDAKPLTIQGDGSQTRTFLYVDDLISGLIKVMNKGKCGEVYNIGSEKKISILKLAEKVLKITGSKSKIRYISRPGHDHQSRLPDLTKIKKLGFNENISLDRGLRLTYPLTS